MEEVGRDEPTYLIEQKILGPRDQLSITAAEFNALRDARDVLFEALEFEQRYELLIGNFIEMELTLAEHCLVPQYSHSTVTPI